MKEFTLTEKGIAVLGFLQKNKVDTLDKAMLAGEIAEGLFWKQASVSGSARGLTSKDLVIGTDEAPKRYYLSEEGMKFDLDKAKTQD